MQKVKLLRQGVTHSAKGKGKQKKKKIIEPQLPEPFSLPVNYAPCVTEAMAKG